MMELSRTTHDKALISGPYSVRTQAYRAILREIDWALETGSTKYRDAATRAQAFRDFAALAIVWKVGSKEYKGNTLTAILVPYDGGNIKYIASLLMVQGRGEGSTQASAQGLYDRGSVAVGMSTLQKISYSRQDEMAAMRAVGGDQRHLLSAAPPGEAISNNTTHAVVAAADDEAGDDEFSESGEPDNDWKERPRKPTPQRKTPVPMQTQKTSGSAAEYAKDCRRAIVQFIDANHAGRNLGAKPSTVAEQIAASEVLWYIDRYTGKPEKRTAIKIMHQMQEIVRRYNETVGPGERKTKDNLVNEGSALDLEGHRAAAPRQQVNRLSRTTASSSLTELSTAEVESIKVLGGGSQGVDSDSLSVRGSVSQRKRRSSLTQPEAPKRARSMSLLPDDTVPDYISNIEQDHPEQHAEKKAEYTRFETTSTVLPQTTSLPFANSTSFSLINKDLKRRLQSVYFAISSAVMQQLQQQNIDSASSATWKVKPSTVLAKAYHTIADGETTADGLQASIQKHLTREELASAVLGALMWEDVFSGTSTSVLTFGKFFARQQEALAGVLPLYETQLQVFHTSFDTQMRRLHLSWLRQPETCEGEVAEIADLLKHRFAGLMLEHLQGRGRVDRGESDMLSIKWARALAEPIKDALLLNAEISCAREKYGFHWPTSGTPFNGGTMEGTFGEGEAVVATMFPGLVVRNDDDSIEVVAKACVKAL